MLALAGILQFSLLPSGAQVLFQPSPLSAGLTADGNAGAFLPVHRLTMTVLDDAERPVAGASFSGRHFSGDGNAGEAPLTDERGTATLLFRFPLDASSSLSNLWLTVAHSNHAQRVIQWTAPPGRFLETFRTNYTVRFAATGTIGGIVRDTAGQPVPGARVQMATTFGVNRRAEVTGAQEHSRYYSALEARMVTDANGVWTASGVPVDLDGLSVLIVRSDGAATSFSTSGGTSGAPLELAALRRNDAVMTLPEGMTVRGKVVDDSGQAVSSVRLVEWHWRTAHRHVFSNGFDGRFELPHRTASQVQFLVESPGHVPFTTNLMLQPDTPELHFVLSPARLHPFAATVLDHENRPVVGARFFSGYLTGQNWSDQQSGTDDQGRAMLSFRFPKDSAHWSPLVLNVDHSNYFRRTIVWTAAPDRFFDVFPTNYTVRFAATGTVGGYVRDEAGRPVAEAWLDLQAGEQADRYGERNEPDVREFTESFTRSGVITDTNGFWNVARIPMDVAELNIVVRRPAGAVSGFSGSEHAGELALDMAALRRTNAVLKLPETFTVRGIVVSEDGRAVSGVSLREQNMVFEDRRPVPGARLRELRMMSRFWLVTNRSDGRFEVPHESPRQLRVHVESPFYKGFTTNIVLDISKPELRLVLPERLAIRQYLMTVTVLDAAGQPVEGARLFGSDLRDDNWGGRSPTTDERGIATLTFRASDDRPLGSRSTTTFTRSGKLVTSSRSTVQVSVQHSNHAQRSISWSAPTEKLLSVLPTNYTARFPGLGTIGGYIRDERGGPVAGARLEIRSSGSSSYEENAVWTNEVSEFYLADKAALVTGPNGFWSASRVPADLEELHFLVARPGGAVSRFSSALNSGDSRVDIALLRRSEVVLTVPDGVAVRGVVVDESGQPVSRVPLRERSEARGGYYAFTNQADGRFELPHRTASHLQLSVDSPRHAALCTNVSLDPANPELRLVVSRQRPARLRVLDEKGKPIQRAYIQPLEARNGGLGYGWTGTTDQDGRVTWTNAPAGTVIVMVSGAGAPVRRLRLTSRDDEVVVRMERKEVSSATLHLKVVEAETGRPIPGATVLRTFGYGRELTDVGQAGPDGLLKTTLRATNSVERERIFNLMVRHEGYLQWLSSESFAVAEGDIELTAVLRKGRAAGVVLRPDGQPAAGATVFLNPVGIHADSYRPGEFRSSDSRSKAKSVGADGAFEFSAAAGDDRLIAFHRAGFVDVAVEDLSDRNRIALQPWARIEGVVKSGGKPLARQRVGLRSPLSASYIESYSFQYSAMADASGRFVFTNVPPGEHILVRYVGSPQGGSVDSHRLPVTVGPGQTREVSYELGGRFVTGFVDVDGEIDWTREPQVLEAKVGHPPSGPVYSGTPAPGSYDRIRRAHARSAAMLNYERKRQQFQLVFDRDGAFRIEDVPPGTYELRLRALEPPSREEQASGRWSQRAEIASLVREIVVPSGSSGTEIDLGTIWVQRKQPASPASKSAPLSFRATTLDGRPFELSSERGRPALVVFWTGWAPRSNARFAELSAAGLDRVSKTNYTLIGVNLDEDPAPARQNAQRLGNGWKHLRLTGPARFEITEQLGIEILPATFLLDADGSVVARDPGGRRVAAVLNRLNSQASSRQ